MLDKHVLDNIERRQFRAVPGQMSEYWYEDNKRYTDQRWREEVIAGATRLGYWQWVELQKENEEWQSNNPRLA